MQLSKTERQEAYELLVSLLNTPSVNGSEGELRMAEKIFTLLTEAGIEAQLEPQGPLRANVLAFVPGQDSSKTILLNGHVDTVQFGSRESWRSDPATATLVGRELFARGATDMKSGLAGMIMVLRLMQRKQLTPRVNLCFLACCDEESSGAGARAVLDKACLKSADMIFVAEPTDLKLGLAEKACNWLKLIVFGKTGHGAYPERGVNAIERGFAIVERLKEELQDYKHPLLGPTTIQITQLNAGIVPNMTPERAEFVLDIRNTPSLSNERLFALLEGACAEEAALTKSILRTNLDIINSRPPLETAVDDTWVKAFSHVCQAQTGKAPEAIGLSFYTDASLFVQANAKASILMFGPGEPGLCHQANEYVNLDKYEKFIEILGQFLTVKDGKTEEA